MESQEVVSAPEIGGGRKNACPDVAAMIAGWATHTPSERNPAMASGFVRPNCAHRSFDTRGCITEADFELGPQTLIDRHARLCVIKSRCAPCAAANRPT